MPHRVLVVALVTFALLSSGAATNDPLVGEQYHLQTVRAFDAWQASRGQGMVVAVVDTGVSATHPDLQGRMVGGVDLIEPGTPPDDDNGHGTLVAGVIAANAGNGVGVAG
ncbi:MAG: S8 family serine peptidase, partial [Actinomycetota bacterium]|nr:S8 family serine peptidase [Actinomycetota bacterium]